MGVRITLYVFQNGPGLITQVFTDSDNLTLIDAENFSGTGAPSAPDPGTIVNSQCSGTTRYTYRATVFNPYANYEIEFNSPYCGGTPPTCDIFIATFVVTDETEIGANNGSINMFAVSSFGDIEYSAVKNGDTIPIINSTGFFPDLEPGIYFVTARDSNGCQVERDGEVHAFSGDYTHFKYKLTFNTIDLLDEWEIQLYDKNNNYLAAEYPKDIAGIEQPILLTQEDQNEDKATAIISRSVDINLWYDGESFTTDEFTLAQERQWFVIVTRNSEIEFQGWLLPDEIQDLYADAPYPFQLKATDGLPSLKGNVFGDGSGGNGYSNSQVQQYGVTGWGLLVKQCLDQLGYDYGTSIILSSLQYNNTYNANLWPEIGTWSDILYDTQGVAVDTYTALELLLKGLKVALIQVSGQFVFLNWNDISYRLNPLTRAKYLQSLYEISNGFDSIEATGTGVIEPSVYEVGFDKPNKPINPPQSLNYDKAYNITAKLDFTFLALLYENPSFEIGSVENGLPENFQLNNPSGKVDYKLHNVGTLAYLGDWVFTGTYLTNSFTPPDTDHAHFIDSVVIDQPNKLLNFSIQFKAYPVAMSGGDITTTSSRPIMGIVFRDDTSGNIWEYFNGTSEWIQQSSIQPSLSGFQIITDYLAWNAYTIATTVFPETGIGVVDVYFFGPDANKPSGDPGDATSGQTIRVDFDQFVLTLSDANDQYSLQIGETHSVTAVTGIPQANNKEIDLKLFTYPPNKRIAGNVFTQNDYANGEVQNKWNFALKTGDPQDRLPATITKAFGRAYQRPMRIFEGDIETNYLSYYAVFLLRFYEDTVYMPFSIQLDPRNGIGHIRLIEIIDDEQQAVYTYTPVFQKDARQVVSQ